MENLSKIKELKEELKLIELARGIAGEYDYVPSKEEADQEADWYIENIKTVDKEILVKAIHKYENTSYGCMNSLYEDVSREIINLI
jgi:hypothetical protein